MARINSAIVRLKNFGNNLETESGKGDGVAGEAERFRLLGLAYLNLRHHRSALFHLRRAAGLSPNDKVLACTIEILERHSRRRGERSDVQRTPVSQSTESFRGASVLLIDDSPTIRKRVALDLQDLGIGAQTAAGGLEALSKLRGSVPDLILLDITMPNLDGYQLCKLIRQHRSTSDVPIVILSGRKTFLDRVKGRSAGAVDYLTKPVCSTELERILNKYVKSESREQCLLLER